MVISCAALGCKKKQNSLDDNGNKISFHRFPKKKDLCLAWLEAAKREDFVPTKFSYLCSEHFTDDQFNRAQNPNSSRLKPNAIPTVFKGYDSLRKKKPAIVALKQEPGGDAPSKQAYAVQNRVKIAPRPEKVVIDTVTPPNIVPALNAFQPTTSFTLPSDLGNGTPVSIYIVRPQPDGSSIVTIPSTSPVNLGGITTANVASLSTSNLGSFANLGTISSAANIGFVSSPSSQTSMSENLDSSSDGNILSDQRDEEIKKCQERLENYRKDIKALQQKHRRQKRKIEKLQEVIKELKNPEYTDEEEDLSEDISEEEIFEELLKHQTDSEFEDIDEGELENGTDL